MINRMVFAGFSMKIASWCVVKPSIMLLRIWRKLLWFKLFLSMYHWLQSWASRVLLFGAFGIAAQELGYIWISENHRNLLESILIMVQILKKIDVCNVCVSLWIRACACDVSNRNSSIFCILRAEMQYQMIQKLKFQCDWEYIRGIRIPENMKATHFGEFFCMLLKTNNNPQ